MLSNDIYKEILKEYEEMSDNAKHILENKKQLLYQKCPRIKEIDDELNLTCIKLSKALIGALKEDKQNYINEIKECSEKLQAEKKKLMLENGFSNSYFEDIYNCKKCKDTGFIKNNKCQCFEQKLINKAYNMSNLSKILKTENFKSFNLKYYSTEIDKENGMSPFQNMTMIMRKVSIFIEEFEQEFRNIMFYGNPGLGKTFLCQCIAKEILDKGKSVVYITAFELFDIIQKEHFTKNNDSDSYKKETLKLKNEIDLLIIDDLGTEFITSLSKSELFNIINSRILNKKSTIISTNISPEKLMNLYSSRIISRFYGEYEMIKLFGEDIRLLKKFKS